MSLYRFQRYGPDRQPVVTPIIPARSHLREPQNCIDRQTLPHQPVRRVALTVAEPQSSYVADFAAVTESRTLGNVKHRQQLSSICELRQWRLKYLLPSYGSRSLLDGSASTCAPMIPKTLMSRKLGATHP